MLKAEPTFSRVIAALEAGALELLSKLHDCRGISEVVKAALERANRWQGLMHGRSSIVLDPSHTFKAQD